MQHQVHVVSDIYPPMENSCALTGVHSYTSNSRWHKQPQGEVALCCYGAVQAWVIVFIYPWFKGKVL